MSSINVLCCYSPAPREVLEWRLRLPSGVDVQQALSLLLPKGHWTSDCVPAVGIWGRKVSPSQVLQDGDRLELYRPLKVDPKVARRQRFKRQGAKRSGLFANRRPGSVPGY